MNTQEDQEFTAFLRSKAAEGKQTFGFPATKFLGMLGAEGGYKTACNLLAKKRPSDGFTDLWTHNRLDLSVEAVVVETKWRSYFDKLLIAQAESLLRQSNYAFKPFSPTASDSNVDNGKSEALRVVGPGAANASHHVVNQSDHVTNNRYWWVNQNQTYKTEVPGGFLWSPKTKADGARNQFYDNMSEVNVGDVIFSFCDTRIKAMGVAVGKAETSTKPDFGGAGTNWSTEGWLVPVEFKELHSQIRPKDYIDLIRPHLPKKYSPLQESGDGLQSVYLTSVPAPMADVLAGLIGDEFYSTLKSLQDEVDQIEFAADHQEAAIKGRTDIGATSKEQLVKSRRGQGVFKANVRLNEKGCRITGVTDPLHLRASHIKPWKDSTDEEKLNGCNGLLLAPHVDHLFDRGFISFSENGSLLVSKQLDQSTLAKWGISTTVNVGTFKAAQIEFLKYHMNSVFRG